MKTYIGTIKNCNCDICNKELKAGDKIQLGYIGRLELQKDNITLVLDDLRAEVKVYCEDCY